MNKNSFKRLLRETILKLLEEETKFKEGDRVVNKDGDDGTVVLAKHPYYSVEMDETGTSTTYHYTDLTQESPDYGKYDTSNAPDLEESANEDLIHLDGLLVIQDNAKLTEILSDIRSITGITIVRTEDIPGDTKKTKLFIKIDPFPLGDMSEDGIKTAIKSRIRKIPGVREFWSAPPKPIQELKFKIRP